MLYTSDDTKGNTAHGNATQKDNWQSTTYNENMISFHEVKS